MIFYPSRKSVSLRSPSRPCSSSGSSWTESKSAEVVVASSESSDVSTARSTFVGSAFSSRPFSVCRERGHCVKAAGVSRVLKKDIPGGVGVEAGAASTGLGGRPLVRDRLHGESRGSRGSIHGRVKG